MAAVNLRHIPIEISAYMLQTLRQVSLQLLGKAITHCGNIEPSGVGGSFEKLVKR